MRIDTNILQLFFMLLPFISLAQKKPIAGKDETASRTYALVIGVADYANLPKLQFSDKDALEFYLYLRKLSPADTSRFFIFLNKNASLSAAADRLYKITRASRPGDKVFIYFSGHGDIEQLENSDNFFLLLAGCSSKDYLTSPNSILEKSFLDHFIKPMLEKKVKIIFICDACHSGKLVGGDKGRTITSNALMKSWSSEIKLLSCQPNQTSLESTKWGEGRSLFSWYLVLGLKGLADMDKDGKVSLSEIDKYLNDHVKEAAKTFNMDQWPTVSGDKDFALSKTSEKLLNQASLQNKQNIASDDYKGLAGEKGSKVKVGNNMFVFKSMPGMSDGYLQMENSFIIADKFLQTIYFSFKNAVRAGNLILPEQASGYYYYTLLKQNRADSSLLDETRILLLNALLQSYDDLLVDFYKNRTSVFYNNLQQYNPENLKYALELSSDDELTASQVKAKQLFLQACMLTPVSDTSKFSGNAAQAILLLQDALRSDTSNPAIYEKLGELYMASRQYKEALEACIQYQRMLPNDAQVYNRKGLLYLSLQQNDLAIAEFTRALQLDPANTEARSNLLRAQQKKE